jgi:hypothetical protein
MCRPAHGSQSHLRQANDVSKLCTDVWTFDVPGNQVPFGSSQAKQGNAPIMHLRNEELPTLGLMKHLEKLLSAQSLRKGAGRS